MRSTILFFSILFFTSILQATIINVPADTISIQGGIDLAIDGDTVLVADGLYFENINFKGKAITVASHFYLDGDVSHISKTVIDGSKHTNPDSGSVVYFISGEDTTSILSGFTITRGSGTYFVGFNRYGGGGICMRAGGKILHNKIIGNTMVRQKQSYGAGLIFVILNANANLIISYNEFKYNSIVSPYMSGGGGLYLRPFSNDGYMRINNNIISYNSTTCTGTYKAIGGGLGVSLDLPTLETVIIESNIISHNELHCPASVGAGIYVVYWEPGGLVTDENPNPLIFNNIIADNYSEEKGGGIGIWTVEDNHNSNSKTAPQPVIINNTIVNNKADDGCGIFNFDSYPLLLNNIFWDDLSVSGSREIFNDNIYYPGYSDHVNNGIISIHYSDIQGGWIGEGNFNAEPLFVDAVNGDFNLVENSPGIGWGTDSITVNGNTYTCPASDYYGNIRPYDIDEFLDMGAIESPYNRTVTAIDDDGNTLPTKFALLQNYPNPFNPTTTISYQLVAVSNVDLSIYNILGQKVVTLVSAKKPAGSFMVEWDASGFSSGIYFYRLETDKGFVQSKKLILLK